PDISFTVSKLAQFMNSYDITHWTAAKGVLRYLKGTANMGITYHNSGDMQLMTYTDSDYARDKLSRNSTSGYLLMLNGSAITWSSQKQPCIALSSTEAEYIALSSGSREIVWLRSFLKELGFPQNNPTPILVENQSAIRLVKNTEMHARTKHIDVRFHYTRELVDKQEIHIQYVPTGDQLADCLTKPLLKGKLEENRHRMGLTVPCASATSHSPPVLWRKSQFPVTTGHAQVVLAIAFLDPCVMMMTDDAFHAELAPLAVKNASNSENLKPQSSLN
ncbi:unnamed protein product, partial [Allacma fusca]